MMHRLPAIHRYFLLLLCSVGLVPSLSFASMDNCAGGTGNVVVIEGQQYLSDDTCEATISISTNPGVHVEGGRVTYSAPSISLNGVFGVKAGASFIANGGTSTAHIKFIGDQSVVLNETDQQATFKAMLVDSDGVEIPGIELVWSLATSNDIQLLSSDGSSAIVKAIGNTFGNALLTAAYPPINVSADAQILIAELAADAVYLGSQHVLSKVVTVDSETITLQRNIHTEAIQVGDIVVSGDAAGLLIRVTSISMSASQVILSGDPVSLAEAFANLSITNNSSQLQSVTIEYDFDSRVSKVRGMDGDTRSILDGITCKDESNNDVAISLTGGSITFEPSFGLRGSLIIENHTVEEFSLKAEAKMSVVATTGNLSFDAELTKKVTCKLELFTINTPSIPLYGLLSATLAVTPVVGVDAAATFSGASFTIEGPRGNITGSSEAGICYTRIDRWSACAVTGFSTSFQPVSANFTKDVAFGMSAGPFGLLDLGLTFDLGKSDLSINLVDLRFIELKAAMPMDLEFSAPFDFRDPAYEGPIWEISREITGKFKFDLAGGELVKLIEQIGIDVAVDVSSNIFTPIRKSLFRSPLVEGTVSCNPRCPIVPSQGGGSLDLKVSAWDPAIFRTVDREVLTRQYLEYTGTAYLFVSKDNENKLSERFSAPLSGGPATMNWVPQAGDVGRYEIFPRIETDLLSKVFPYGSKRGRKVCVGEDCVRYIKLDSNGDPLPYDASEWTCVKEKETGLVWERKEQYSPWFWSRFKRYTWNEGLDYAKAINDMVICGGSGWRMPTKDELKMLVYCGSEPEAPLPDYEYCLGGMLDPSGNRLTIDTSYFPNTIGLNWAAYWSATIDDKNPDSMWCTSFTSGETNSCVWVNRLYVRLVRDGQ